MKPTQFNIKMKRFVRLFLLLSVTALSITACKKENKNSTHCYECKNLNGTSNYQDAGCMTNDQWNSITFTDQNGNTVDKNSNCRRR